MSHCTNQDFHPHLELQHYLQMDSRQQERRSAAADLLKHFILSFGLCTYIKHIGAFVLAEVRHKYLLIITTYDNLFSDLWMHDELT